MNDQMPVMTLTEKMRLYEVAPATVWEATPRCAYAPQPEAEKAKFRKIVESVPGRKLVDFRVVCDGTPLEFTSRGGPDPDFDRECGVLGEGVVLSGGKRIGKATKASVDMQDVIKHRRGERPIPPPIDTRRFKPEDIFSGPSTVDVSKDGLRVNGLYMGHILSMTDRNGRFDMRLTAPDGPAFDSSFRSGKLLKVNEVAIGRVKKMTTEYGAKDLWHHVDLIEVDRRIFEEFQKFALGMALNK